MKQGDKAIYLNGREITIQSKLENQLYSYIFTYNDDYSQKINYAYSHEVMPLEVYYE